MGKRELCFCENINDIAVFIKDEKLNEYIGDITSFIFKKGNKKQMPQLILKISKYKGNFNQILGDE